MKQILIWCSLIALAFAGDDAWTKVKALKSGSDVRILKAGSKETVIGKFDEADEERLVLVLTAIVVPSSRACSCSVVSL